MTNPYYNHGGYPSTRAQGASAQMRAELDLVMAGFDKLPVLTGQNNKVVIVNSAGDGLASTDTVQALTIATLTVTTAFTTTAPATIDGNLTVTGAGDFDTIVVDANSAGTAFRVTQAGGGDVARFEDVSSDSTPIVIDASGRLVIGHGASIDIGGTQAKAQLLGAGADSVFALARFEASGIGPALRLAKSRHATVGSNALVSDGDTLGSVDFYGANGVGYSSGAAISAVVTGTPGVGDMPTRLRLMTTPDGSETSTTRMVILPAGNVLVGSDNVVAAFDAAIHVQRGANGTTAMSYRSDVQFGSATTSLAVVYSSAPTTVAAGFTMTELEHFRVDPVGIGAGSAVSAEIGYFVAALSAGTGRRGFQSNVTPGTGRYDIYAGGGAFNYLAGETGIGGSEIDDIPLTIQSHASNAVAVTHVERSTGSAIERWINFNRNTERAAIVVDGSVMTFATGATRIGRMQLGNTGNISLFTRLVQSWNAVAFSATPTFDFAHYNRLNFNSPMTTNVTAAIANVAEGQEVEIFVQQDATGGRTFTVATNSRIAGSVGTLPSQMSCLSLRIFGGTLIGGWTVFPQ